MCVAGEGGRGGVSGVSSRLCRVATFSPWSLPRAHVRLDDVDLAMPLLVVVPLQEDIGVRILLHCPDFYLYIHRLAGLQCPCDEWASSSPDHGHNNFAVWIRGRVSLLNPVSESTGNRSLVPVVFHGIFLEDFIHVTFKIVCEWL